MLDKLTNSLDFQAKALVLRADRQRDIASNIANADTPGYAARDFSFADAMREATGGGTPRAASGASADGRTDARHIPLTSGGGTGGSGASGGYAVQTQPSLDGNSVDLDRERAAFADNAVRYEATLRFINGQGKTLLAAIQGQ
ncbi:flagellar basal body rod protein FlgB [Variovorax sp. CY25R-8]|uniref:flagellar basal body rod protein FlgB n=1 Tax=Variovorax sp. CY25R-8 TaxID=2855501 RepID=UPI0021BB7059|nr:flagellar basal body rod protein FlgB [Variovorax sp. CY25R-8]MCT8173658.1 flagellar basal body rod protein FlgB [Variovorax sp. CY25R-8]